MTRTGKPETVSLTVNGPTRTYGQHTKPTPCAGPGAGATGRTEHMQEQKNNTEPKFITIVYVHETKLQILKPRMRCPLGSGGNNSAWSNCVAPTRFPIGIFIRHGLMASAYKPISTRNDTKVGGKRRIIVTRLIAWDMRRGRRDSRRRSSAHRSTPAPMKSKKGSANASHQLETNAVVPKRLLVKNHTHNQAQSKSRSPLASEPNEPNAAKTTGNHGTREAKRRTHGRRRWTECWADEPRTQRNSRTNGKPCEKTAKALRNTIMGGQHDCA